jgi:hypothetical protein
MVQYNIVLYYIAEGVGSEDHTGRQREAKEEEEVK